MFTMAIMEGKRITEVVQTRIHTLRKQKVILDYDLAEFYEVETKRVNEAVKNNPDKFPDDFLFELTDEETQILKSKISTSSWGGRRYRPKAFTEQGVYMLATILKSAVATQVSIAIMRAFVNLRRFSLTYGEIIERLGSIDKRVSEHDEIIQNLISALSELLRDIKEEESKRIGFI